MAHIKSNGVNLRVGDKGDFLSAVDEQTITGLRPPGPFWAMTIAVQLDAGSEWHPLPAEQMFLVERS